ncbi:MAG: O-antigen ligase family protein, partial [Coriobacteriia bacterium]
LAPTAVSAALALGLAVAFALLASERPELGVVALVGAAALDVTGRVATVAGVQLTAYQLVVAALVAVLGVRAVRRRARVPATPADLPAALFLAFALAAVPGAVSPKLAAVSFLSLLSSVVLLYLVVVAVDTPERGETVVWGLLAIAAVLGALALVERAGLYSIQPLLKAWGYGIRAKTTFKDPNVFGSFLACAAAFGVPFALERRGTVRRLAAWGAVTVTVLGLVVTFSRGAWGGFLLALVVVLVFARVPLRVKTAFVGVAGLLLAVLLLRYLDPGWVREKLVDVGQNRSFMYRIYMGGSALRMWLDHPWGVGPGNYPLVFPAYRDAFVAPGLVESHTAYLTVLVETGLAGLAGLLWLVWRFLTRTARAALTLPEGAAHAIAVGALAAGVALLAQAFTYSLETSKFLWLTVGLGMAAARMSRTPRGEE